VVVLVVGEALVDVVVPHGPDAGQVVRRPGGSPMNVAVGLARLEVPTRLVTRLGDDDDGRLVREHLAASHVHLAPGTVDPDASTGVATAYLDEDGVATYDFQVTWDLPPTPLPEDCRALHVGSIGAGVRPGRDVVVALAAEAHAAGLPVSFDPNARPAFTPDADVAWQDVLDLAALCDLVKLSDEDAAFFRPGVPVIDVARAILERGPALVVVTGGGGVATAVSRAGVVVVAESRRVEVADTVGAGDSFMAALVAATLPDRAAGAWVEGPTHSQVAEYLSAAHAAAAVTVTRRGADPPRLAELPPGWPRV
jgi:fructokinase